MQQSRKVQIREAFINLYSEKDINQISVQELCDLISMSRTGFYHYYDDLYELLQELIHQVLYDLQDLNKDFYRIDLNNYQEAKPCYDTLAYIHDNSSLFKALLRHQGTNNFVYQWKQIISDDFRKRYLFQNKNDSKLDLILEMTSSAVIGLYDYWLRHPEDITEDEIAGAILFQVCHTLV